MEQCPKCGQKHQVGPYFRHEEEGKIYYAPNDVTCSCGLTLRWTVPFFKVTASGYVLRVKHDDEIFRNSTIEEAR